MSAFESFVRSMGRYDSFDKTVIWPLKPFSRRPSIAPIAPEPPPTMATCSAPAAVTGLQAMLGLRFPALMEASSPVMNTEPFFTDTGKVLRWSRAGAFSMSPELVLKQAPCQGQVILPSAAITPLTRGAP